MQHITPASPRTLATMLGMYVAFMLVLAFDPVDRVTWFMENATVWLIVGGIVFAWMKGIRFSLMAYSLMAVLVFLHTIGGHYTFAKVPFQWVMDLFGTKRDFFDRIAHFTVGFYAFAFAEWLIIKKSVRGGFVLTAFPIALIMAIAAAYEIEEMAYAIAFGGAQAADYLGSQGDIWDAQWDMTADTLGAFAAMMIFWVYYGKRRIHSMLAK